MKILHDQTQLKRSLIIGIAFLSIGIASLFSEAKTYLAALGGVGMMYIVNYFVHKNRAYVTLNPNTISKGYLFKKEIHLKDIKSIKYFAGDYTIKTNNKEIVIDTNLIDKTSLELLKNYLDNHISSK